MLKLSKVLMSFCSAQELQAKVQEGLEGVQGDTEVKHKTARRLLLDVAGVGSSLVTDAFAATSTALNGEPSNDSPRNASAWLP